MASAPHLLPGSALILTHLTPYLLSLSLENKSKQTNKKASETDKKNSKSYILV